MIPVKSQGIEKKILTESDITTYGSALYGITKFRNNIKDFGTADNLYNITDAGYYYLEGATGGILGSSPIYGCLIVFPYAGDYGTAQILITATLLYTRVRSNRTWQKWQKATLTQQSS